MKNDTAHTRFMLATAHPKISASVSENGRGIRTLMTQAKRAGAQLIHFPESALSGFVKRHIPHWDSFEWSHHEQDLQAITQLAKQLELWVVLGTCHPRQPPFPPYNSVYVISSEGKIVGRYNKQYCSHSEIQGWYTPGQGLMTFECGGWRFGSAICIELQFPELFQAYAAQNVECMLFSSDAQPPIGLIQAQALAATYTMWLSFSVPQAQGDQTTAACIGPDGQVLKACLPRSEMVLTLLDKGNPQFDVALNKARPWRRLARSKEIYKGLWPMQDR